VRIGDVRTRLSDLAAQILASIDVAALVAELLPVRRVGRELTGSCPFHEDHTPSFNVNPESGKFFCFGCQAKGDVFDLVGHLWGVQGFHGQLAAVARWGGLAWALDQIERREVLRVLAPTPKCAPGPAARKTVDREEVAALWSLCRPVTDDAAVSGYLSGRTLDPVAIAERDLARAIPERAKLPAWASCRGVPWNRSNHRLVARLFDTQGQLASLTARRIVEAADDVPKALFPPGPRAGLLLADEAGRWALRAPSDYLPSELWIAEGVTDFLALACDFALDDESAPGSLAIVGPSSWSKAAADRVPDRVVVVVVAVDVDKAGDTYFAEIVKTFGGRPVRIDRWAPKQERGSRD
jgi:hypothetical protein